MKLISQLTENAQYCDLFMFHVQNDVLSSFGDYECLLLCFQTQISSEFDTILLSLLSSYLGVCGKALWLTVCLSEVQVNKVPLRRRSYIFGPTRTSDCTNPVLYLHITFVVSFHLFAYDTQLFLILCRV